MIVEVSAAARTLTAAGLACRCAIGRNGACEAAAKREGDGRTPIGTWPIRAALIRPGRAIAPPRLPWRWLRPTDGWCDAPADPAYNRPVRHPSPVSAERLWRADDRYDAILVIAHNDTPPIAGAGSAIFLHAGESATEGCVAVARTDLVALLGALAVGDALRVAS